MQEDFLHYIWQFKQFNFLNLKSTDNENISIINIGQHNHNSGPDFFNAQIEIDAQLWAGNVEIHIKSSDWYLHNHELDKAYDNVVLHVVWEHDVEVLRANNSKMPTLEIKSYVNASALRNYQNLFHNKLSWINCETQISSVNNFIISNWLEKLYIERLQYKSNHIEEILKLSNNDWEAVMFQLLAKNFGLKVNGAAFLHLSQQIDFSIVRKVKHKTISLEALLFGQANLLNDEIEEAYYNLLKTEYHFLKQKFSLKDTSVQLQFFRLRPNNFPTIRLSQLANLYVKHHSVFSTLIINNSSSSLYELCNISASEYWHSHYTFGKTTKQTSKNITNAFVDLLQINTIIPLKFTYFKSLGKEINEDLIDEISQLKIEKNSIVKKFKDLTRVPKNALHSQALLQLKQNYCDKNKCLQCEIGHTILHQND